MSDDLWRSLQGQWPVLGVDPLSAARLRERGQRLGLAPVAVAAVDWLASLLLFVAPFLAHLLLGRGSISAGMLALLLALGGLLFIALQRPLRYLGLLALGAQVQKGDS